jgi:hypothetical protein
MLNSTFLLPQMLVDVGRLVFYQRISFENAYGISVLRPLLAHCDGGDVYMLVTIHLNESKHYTISGPKTFHSSLHIFP